MKKVTLMRYDMPPKRDKTEFTMRKKLLLLSLLTTCTFANGLSQTELSIKEVVVQQQASQLTLLEKLSNINSGTTNPDGVYKVGELLRPALSALGFKTYWVNEPASMHHAGTLIAEKTGKLKSKLLLIGHLDTVFAPDTTFQTFELKQHSAKGPGVLDDKGGVLVMLYALKALQANHVLKDATITIVLTGDEEESGKPTSISRKPLFEAAEGTDYALDFESAITLDTGTIARRGIASWMITTHGNESHSATIFQKDVGDGAIFEVARILNTMHRQMESTPFVTFNPGTILGGTSINYDNKTAEGTAFGKTNVVAKTAAVNGDYRFLTAKQKQDFEDQVRFIVKQHLPGTKSEVVFRPGIPAMPPTQNNLYLLQKYSAVSEDLGQGKISPLDPGQRGAGDISHIAQLVPANLAGLGPVGIGSHSIIEAVELNSLPIQTERAAILIYRLSQGR